MKKVLLFGLLSVAVLASSNAFGQKKANSKKGAKPTELSTPSIKTESDSVSYVYGIAMSQGLPQYLTQMGVLTDTTAISADYEQRILTESDAAKQTQLRKELKVKLDSATTANAVNMEDFLAGFKQAMLESSTSPAFNSGIAIASQVGSMTKNFSAEVLGQEDAINRDAFVYAFISGLKNETPLFDVSNPQDIIQQKAQQVQQRKEAEAADALKAQYAEQVTAGENFLAENKAKAGVVTLPNGLQYKVITEGTGAKPSATDIVKVHYKGTLIDGTQFDSSYDRNEPTTFAVGHVIKGWTEALKLMPVGSKWMLYIPYDLAYGTRDQGTIKPFSTLIFEVELLDIVSQEEIDSLSEE